MILSVCTTLNQAQLATLVIRTAPNYHGDTLLQKSSRPNVTAHSSSTWFGDATSILY